MTFDPVFVEFVVSTIKCAADWTNAKARQASNAETMRDLDAATFKLGEAVGLIVRAVRRET